MASSRFLQFRRNPTRWTISILVLLLILINFVGWLFYLEIKEALDDELGRRLQSLASTSSLLIDSNNILSLYSSSNYTTAQSNVIKKLDELKTVTQLNDLYIISTNYNILAQTKSTTSRNELRLYLDQEEINSTFQGTPTAGILDEFSKPSYKRGYAPIRDDKGNIVAVLGVEASAPFFQTTQKIRGLLQLMGIISLSLILISVLVLNRIFVTMLRLEERVLETDKLQALAQLSAGVAHEIRNPLGIISGNAELLKEEIINDPGKQELIENIVTESDRLEKILRNYLEFSKPGSLELTEDNINNILDKTLQLCQHQLQKEGIVVTRQLADNLPTVKVDSQRMTQVFLNLILNARESMLQGGWLTVKSSLVGKYVVVELKDSGMGIPPEVLSKIFVPFFTTKKTGSGLGLSIARRIIGDHKGKIEIDSEEGKGTIVQVSLPIA